MKEKELEVTGWQVQGTEGKNTKYSMRISACVCFVKCQSRRHYQRQRPFNASHTNSTNGLYCPAFLTSLLSYEMYQKPSAGANSYTYARTSLSPSFSLSLCQSVEAYVVYHSRLRRLSYPQCIQS
jgi:hypothetical protein